MLKRLKLPRINILFLAVAALMLFIPLYPKFPLFNVPGTYVAIRIEDLLVVSVLFIWFVLEIFKGFSTLKNKVGKFILLYWLVGALSLVSAIFITKHVVPHIALLHFLRRIEYMSLFFVTLASIRSLKNVKNYGLVLFLTTIGIFVYGIGQKFFNWPVVSTMNVEFSKGMLLQLDEWARISSTFAGHYDLAAFLVLFLALSAGFIIGLKSRLSKIAMFIVAFLAFYLLILTASRVSFVAYLVAVTFVLLGLKKYRWLGPVLVLSVVFMLLSSDISQRYAATFDIDLSGLTGWIPRKEREVALVLKPTPTKPVVKKKTMPFSKEAPVVLKPTPTKVATAAAVEEWKPTTELAVEYSSAIRFKVEWPRALRAFAKNPFLGTGYSSVTLATDNDYLRTLAETGLLGFGAFFLIFLEIGRQVLSFFTQVKLNLEKALVVGICGAILGMFANAVFIDVFVASKVAFIFWILMGILVGITRLRLVRQLAEEENEKNNF
ncbi:MAG TPA: O-antigen ligase family protein [Nevskiaceae bacterium]|nr:O-antigen ligase family protein [Nevskiaceae bacterium]